MSRQPLRLWWIGVSALLICIGSVGPWAKVLFISANGLDGDGWITLIAGLAALAFFAVYVRSDRRPRPAWPLVLIFLAAGIAAAVGVYDWSEIQNVIDDDVSEDNPFAGSISVGWGLVLVTVASFSLAISVVVAFLRRGREPAPPSKPQDATGESHPPS